MDICSFPTLISPWLLSNFSPFLSPHPIDAAIFPPHFVRFPTFLNVRDVRPREFRTLSIWNRNTISIAF